MHMLFFAGWNFSFAFMRYSDWWRQNASEGVPSIFSASCSSILLFSTIEDHVGLSTKPLQSPDNFFQHVRHHAGSIIMKTVDGYEVEPDGDRFVHLVDQTMISVRLKTYLLPVAKFKKLAQRWRKNVEDMREEPFRYAAESVGTTPSSFVSENSKNMKQDGASESETYLEILKNVSGVAFGADADTTVHSEILAFMLYPEDFAKVQAELDDVVG
ncbi:hypothetical protein DFS33DRAFT_1382926 [Desarmillaria ectypa]|nr:hypothetical protein DFS33DRAFT_1382926 [Desarmillaria ectypa]